MDYRCRKGGGPLPGQAILSLVAANVNYSGCHPYAIITQNLNNWGGISILFFRFTVKMLPIADFAWTA